ncbi:hypothetical protein EM595_1083 [Duffyella gerundensis]|uniref:Uncharacterized protein n=1 Tax=Duffyella gerundensis TaxID=1619313 RepID=A0A0U5L4B0_9GAMM|nr:hypothetical protein EM595_1083 [Duffyella gerundensis]
MQRASNGPLIWQKNSCNNEFCLIFDHAGYKPDKQSHQGKKREKTC